MKLLFNGNLIDDTEAWKTDDRAFLYGDGFFETMLCTEQGIPLLSEHLARVEHAAGKYRFTLPPADFRFLEEDVSTLRQVNEVNTSYCKARLTIWRRTGHKSAGYRTGESRVNWALSVSPHDRPLISGGIRLGISEQVRITPHPWSGPKSMNALPYVMASLEVQDRNLDDLILPSISGMAAECIESNFFWMEEDASWHTPALSTGCVRGIMRDYLIREMKHAGLRVTETLKSPSDIHPVRAFTCNALRIATVAEYAGKHLREDPGEINQWTAALLEA